MTSVPPNSFLGYIGQMYQQQQDTSPIESNKDKIDPAHLTNKQFDR